MKEFVLLFRMDITTEEAQPSAAQMEWYMAEWMAWINRIAGKGQLAAGGNHLAREGKLLKPNEVIIDGPYISNRESVAGYILILAKDMDDAIGMAKECPILKGEGTSVEVRQVSAAG